MVPVARHVRLELGRRYLLEHYGKSDRIHYVSKHKRRLEEVKSFNLEAKHEDRVMNAEKSEKSTSQEQSRYIFIRTSNFCLAIHYPFQLPAIVAPKPLLISTLMLNQR